MRRASFSVYILFLSQAVYFGKMPQIGVIEYAISFIYINTGLTTLCQISFTNDIPIHVLCSEILRYQISLFQS